MALHVYKFGGTSVANTDCIELVADKIVTAHNNGDDLVVVVSAMSGETNRLIKLAKSLQHTPGPKNLDVLVSTGEQVTIALLCMALEQRGVSANNYTGAQIRIVTDNSHGKARIVDIETIHIRNDLEQRKVVVVAGFQGVTESGRITTLGRGGSDTTAVALAAALNADECRIYTDVDGVYTTDPRVEPKARRLNRVTFEEMLEMASLGSKVLQIRSVEFAGKYDVPLRVLSTFKDGEGTLISKEDSAMEQALISGIAFNRDEAQLILTGVPDRPGIAAQILGPIADANIEVDMIVQNTAEDNTTDFSFTVHRNDCTKALDILRTICDALGARQANSDDNIVKVSLVGVGMRSHAGIAAQMFRDLARENINIRMISTSEIKISVVIDEKYLELAVRTFTPVLRVGLGASSKICLTQRGCVMNHQLQQKTNKTVNHQRGDTLVNTVIVLAIVILIFILWQYWQDSDPETTSETQQTNSGESALNPETNEQDKQLTQQQKLGLANQDENQSTSNQSGDGSETENQSSEATNLPPLENSDSFVRESLTGLSDTAIWRSWLKTPQPVRKFAQFAENLSRGKVPHKYFQFLKPSGAFSVRSEGGDQYYLDPAGYKRYDAIARTIDSLDAEQVVSVYTTLEPLLDTAWSELKPQQAANSSHDFDNILLAAIKKVRSAPVIHKRIQLTRPSVMYQYADPRLEKLNAVSKQMLRMGPKNTRLIQKKLDDIEQRLLEHNNTEQQNLSSD